MLAGLLCIEVDPDIVTIEGQVIKRPRHIGVYAWMTYWENRIYAIDWSRINEELREEVHCLKYRVHELEDHIENGEY